MHIMTGWNMLIRLDKYLADSGYGTRSEVRSFLRIGRVSVNGVAEKNGARKVDPDQDRVTVDQEIVSHVSFEYYMLHKPSGIISASKDKTEKTVVDLIKSKKRRDLFPVGRLDRDTEGLLIITNDGDMAHKLLSPKKHVEKTYAAIVSGVFPENAVEEFEHGIDIGDDKLTKPAKFSFSVSTWDIYLKEMYDSLSEEREDLTVCEVRITEGRFHEIKRMFQALGLKVEYLKRYSMGSIKLDAKLSPGEYRALTEEEIELLASSI